MMSMRGVTKRIQSIKFALLSTDEIRRMSATKIITADTYDDDGFPIDMGLMDSHLGVIEPGLRCKTCGGKVDDCPGHFGHIDLAMPVIHVGYVKDIKKLLQATCRKCGRLLLTRQQAQEYMAEMEQVEELGGDVTEVGYVTKETAREAQKRQRCPHCGEEQGKVTLDKPTTFREDGHKLTPKEVRERLERIPNEDLRVLGMNPEVARPEWMVLTALLVPPVTVPLHHVGERGPIGGRPDPQARRRASDQPAAPREPRRGRPPANRRGSVGAPSIPRHDVFRQPDVGHPAREAPVRSAVEEDRKS